MQCFETFPFNSEQIIKHELHLSYLNKYIQQLSNKIKGLFTNYIENLDEIKEYEDQLIDLLQMTMKYINIYGKLIKKHNLLFINELFELLLYSDNWDLITIILSSLQGFAPIKGAIPKKAIFQISLKNRYILPYLQSFFFNSKSKHPYYKTLMIFEEFTEIRKEFETKYFGSNNNPIEDEFSELFNIYSDDVGSNENKENSNSNFEINDDPDTFKAEIEIFDKENNKQNIETWEINEFHTKYSKDKPSFLILDEILKEKKQDDLSKTNFKCYIDLLYKIKFLKTLDEPQKRINYLICQLTLNSLRADISYISDTETKMMNDNLENYFCLGFLINSNFIKNKQLLKIFLQNYNLVEFEAMKLMIKNNEFYQTLFLKISENLEKIIQIYVDDTELISHLCDLLSKIIEFINKKHKMEDLFQNILKVINEIFEKKILNNEKFLKDPLSELSNNPFMNNILINILKIYSIVDNLDKNIIENITKVIKNILDTILNMKEVNFSKLKQIHIFEEIYPILFTIIRSDAFNIKSNIFDLYFKEIFADILKIIKSSNDQNFHFFLIKFLQKFLDIFFCEISIEQKNYLYEIIEEVYLNNNIGLYMKLFINLEQCLIELSKINNNLDKQPDHFKRLQIYFKVFPIAILNFNKNLSFDPISSFIRYKSLMKPIIVEFCQNYQQTILKNRDNLNKTIKKIIKENNANDLVSPILINFEIYRCRKIKKGLFSLINFMNKIFKFEFEEEEFFAINNCFFESLSHPFLLGMNEKNKDQCIKFNIFLQKKEKFKFPIELYYLKQILQNLDSFEKSYKNLIEKTKEKRVLLIDLISYKEKFIGNSTKNKSSIEIANLLVSSLKKLQNVVIIEDLQNLSKMKTFLFLLNRNVDHKFNDLDEYTYQEFLVIYFEFASKFQKIQFDFISLFSGEYIQSQLEEYELYTKYELYNFDYIHPIREYNALYTIISINSKFNIKSLIKHYRLIYRIMKIFINFQKFTENFPKNGEIYNKEKTKIDDFFQKTIPKNFALNLQEIDEKNVEKVKFTEFLLNNLLIDGLINLYCVLRGSQTYVSKSKLIDKFIKFHNSLINFITIWNIKIDICKNKNASGKDFFLDIFNYYLIQVFKAYSKSMKIEQILNTINKNHQTQTEASVLKIEKKLPLYKPFLESIMKFDKIFENYDFINQIIDQNKCIVFPDNMIGYKQKDNFTKFSLIIIELFFEYTINFQLIDSSLFFPILKNLYETQVKNNNQTKNIVKDRKIYAYLLSGCVQKVYNSLTKENLAMNEDCEVIKTIYDEFKNQVIPYSIKFDINLENIEIKKKLNLFVSLMSSIASLVLYENHSPNDIIGYDKLFSNSFQFCQSILNFLLKMLDEPPQEELLIMKKSLFKQITSILKSYSTHFLNESKENKSECHQNTINIMNKIMKIHLVPENQLYINTSIYNSILYMIAAILGDMEMNNKIQRDLEENIRKIANLIIMSNYQNFYQINYQIFLSILEKLLIMYDENHNLQKISLEIKIKDEFYDKNTNYIKEKISKSDFINHILWEFELSPILFYEVFDDICYVSEDKQNIFLKKGIGKYLLII